MTLHDLIELKPYSISIRQKLIMHMSLIEFSNESIVEFATTNPTEYYDIKDLIPEKFKTPEITLMNKVMCYKV